MFRNPSPRCTTPMTSWQTRRNAHDRLRPSDPRRARPRPRGSTVIDGVVKGVRCLLAFTRTAAAIFLISSVAINFVNIIGRYFFSVSIPWAEEIMLFLMVGCVFTGCCAVAWEGRQIRMDVAIGMLPPKLRELVNAVSELAMIATAAAVAYFAWP